MTTPLTERERELFNELRTAAQILVTVSRNAATVLSEEFEGMVTGPAAAVQAVLDQCAPIIAPTWDGEFRIEDCDEETYTPDVPDQYRDGRINCGVKLIHRPTSLAAQSDSSADQSENRKRAARALKQRTQSHFRAQGGDGRKDPLH